MMLLITEQEFQTTLDALEWASDETSSKRYEELLKKLVKEHDPYLPSATS